MSNIAELQKDLEELLSLKSQSQRKRVQDIIQGEISKLKSIVELEKNSTPQPINKEETKEQKITDSRAVDKNEEFSAINTYSWDQEGKTVKIYLSLPDIGTLDKSNIKFEVTDHSVDIKLHDYKNKNQRFAIKRLNNRVDVSHCKFTQKTNTLIISLKKDNSEHWDQLNYKEKPIETGDKQQQQQGSMQDKS